MKKIKINFTQWLICTFIIIAIVIGASSFLINEIILKIIFLIVGYVNLGILIFGAIILIYAPKKELHQVDERLDFYIDEIISKNGVGAIILSEKHKIIWASNFIKQRFGDEILGKVFLSFHEDIKKMFLESEKNTIIEQQGFFYEINYYPIKKMAVVKDVSIEKNAIKKYESEKLVLGEIDIDNFQLFQSSLPGEELFTLQANVIDVLEKLVRKFSISYHQYVNGKFILITNEKTFQKLFNTKFAFLNELRKKQFTGNVNITLSIGFGKGSELSGELMELAKDALLQSQARGGDQVTIYIKNETPIYLGSKSEIAINQCRTKNKNLAEALKKSFKNKKLKNVIIYGHKISDLDAIGSAYGLVELVRTYEKEVFIQNITFDDTCQESKVLYLGDEQNLFISPAKANSITTKKSIVIIVDTAEADRIENPDAFLKTKVLPENIFIIDHHRVSEIPKFLPIRNFHIDTSASSASEMITEIIAFFGQSKNISKKAAQMLLNGIYLDTNKFQKSTSNKTFAAASLLESWGAKASESIEVLKMKEADLKLAQKVISNLKEIKKGYFLATFDGEVPSDIVSIAADEILRIKNRKAAFVIAKVPGTKKLKLSARGIGTNVQIIVENVGGGGGHFGAAAAESDEALSVFKDNIIQAIVSVNDESNFN